MHPVLYFPAKNVSSLDAILGACIGTVESLQSQDAAVALYSLATSISDNITNQTEWLFSVNRWNVATSRAHACAIVAGDEEAQLNEPPSALNGIAVQQKIRELMEDSYWTDAVNPQPQ